MKMIIISIACILSLTAMATSYSCKTTDTSCGFSSLDLGEIKNGQMILTYDLGTDDAFEDVVGVTGIDQECSDSSTLKLCLKTDSDKKLVLSQEDGVEGIQVVLSKRNLTLEYRLTNLIPPFKVQITQKKCNFSCTQL